MVQIKTGDGLIEIRPGKDKGIVCEIEYSDVDCGFALYLNKKELKEIIEGLEHYKPQQSRVSRNLFGEKAN